MADESKLDQILGLLGSISQKVDNVAERVDILEETTAGSPAVSGDVVLEPGQRLPRTPAQEQEAAYEKKTIYKITQSVSGSKPGKLEFYDMGDTGINGKPIFNKTNEGGALKDMIVTDRAFYSEAEAVRRLNKKDPNREKNNSWGYIKSVLYTS